MALPKLETPVYTLTVPSTDEEIKFRPFLVKEQKRMLMAQESEDSTEMVDAVNQLIQDHKKKVQIFGAENRIYVHHKLGELDFYNYWKGKFEKSYPLTYQDKDILKNTHYVVDMSTIKNDGGGSQYTFLEAIYQGCVLVLHRDWVNQGETFKEGVNCLAADTPEELASILSEPRDITNLIKESRKLLKPHLVVKW